MVRDRTETEAKANSSRWDDVPIDRRSYLATTGTALAAAGLTATTVSADSADGGAGESGYHVNGWFPAWAWWDDYRPADVPFELLDFISISEFHPEDDGTVEFAYPSVESSVLEGFRDIDRDGAKVLAMIGGASGSQQFADAVSTASGRERFVETTLEFLRTYDLDGADIDWEFPLSRSASDAENDQQRENFMALLELLRQRFDEAGEQDGKYYWLSAALSPQPWRAREHDTERLGELLDFAEIMTYDFVGGWSSETGHLAPLFSENDDGTHDYPPSSHVSVQAWIEEGIPSEKVNFGIPTYGSVFEGVSAGSTDGLGQSYSTWEGHAAWYHEIAEDYAENSAYETHRDSTAQVPWVYSSSEERFISHDDTQSVSRKCEYVAEHDLHGVMFWQLMGDTSDYALVRTAAGDK